MQLSSCFKLIQLDFSNTQHTKEQNVILATSYMLVSVIVVC